MAAELGFERWSARWEDAVEAPDVDVVAVLTANILHRDVAIAALDAGKHVLCEKPLAPDGATAREMVAAARRTGKTSACGFNYRYFPAVRAMQRLARSGQVGSVRHFRAAYLQDWAAQEETTRPNHSGAGAVLDYSHILDMLLHIVGAPVAVTAATVGFGFSDDDAFAAIVELDGGGLGVLEASRHATGWKGLHRLEINGSECSAWWNMEDPNRLHLFAKEDEKKGMGGFRAILMSEPVHPYIDQWWPPGHVIGWEHTFVHQWRAFLDAVLAGRPAEADQASFEDGARAVELGDGIYQSAATGNRVTLGRDESNHGGCRHGRSTSDGS